MILDLSILSEIWGPLLTAIETPKKWTDIVAPERRDKKITHEVFDILWKSSSTPHNSEAQRKLRSAYYRLWGAVLAESLQNVEGVIDPFKGEQHIGLMTSEQRDKCRQFSIHLIRKYMGAGEDLSLKVGLWSDQMADRITQNIQAISEEQKLEVILRALREDSFVAELRSALSITHAQPLNTSTAALPPPPETEGNLKPKASAELTAQEHYIEGLVAAVMDDYEAMRLHMHQAAENNHAEAGWYLYQHLEESATTPEEQHTALSYLDIAVRGACHPAIRRINILHAKEKKSTPYLLALEAEAQKPDASSTATYALAFYYKNIVNDLAKSEYWYKETLAKDANHTDALLELNQLYLSGKKAFFRSEEQTAASYRLLEEYAATNSKAMAILGHLKLTSNVMLSTEQPTPPTALSTPQERDALSSLMLGPSRDIDILTARDALQRNPQLITEMRERIELHEAAALQSLKRITTAIEYIRKAEKEGVMIAKPILSITTLMNPTASPAEKAEAVQYLSASTHYITGSLGKGSERDIDLISRPYHDNAAMAIIAGIAPSTLLDYYATILKGKYRKRTLEHASQKLKYWQDCAEWSGSDYYLKLDERTKAAEEEEKKRAKVLLGLIVHKYGTVTESHFPTSPWEKSIAAIVECKTEEALQQLSSRLNAFDIPFVSQNATHLYIRPTFFPRINEAYQKQRSEGAAIARQG